jgi:hypothetical protein
MAADTWVPIFVDPIRLGIGSSTAYRPEENVKWWFHSGYIASTVIDIKRATNICSYDLAGASYTRSTYNDRKWTRSTVKTSQKPLLLRSEVTKHTPGRPFTGRIVFGTAFDDNLIEHLNEELSSEYPNVQTDLSPEGKVKITITVVKKASDEQVVCIDDVVADISAAIRSAKVEGIVSRETTWCFENGRSVSEGHDSHTSHASDTSHGLLDSHGIHHSHSS